MTTRLSDALHQLADAAPEPQFAPDLYDQARRARRRRVAATMVAATSAVLITSSVVSKMLQPSSSAGEAAAGAGDPSRMVVDHWLAWLVLVAVLAVAALRWQRYSGARLVVRLAAIAAVGAFVITTAPPGIAWWGEPAGTPGLPNRIVAPSFWTARATGSPPGRAAILFGGPATWGNIEEGRIAMVAGDGERYRVLETFTYEDPGELSRLSPDGRYVGWQGKLIDLATGHSVPNQPLGVLLAWSPDSRRYLYADTNLTIGVWDLETQRPVGSTFRLEGVNESEPAPWPIAAFAPDGSQFALQFKGEPQIQIYRVGERDPYRTLEIGASRLAGTGAWTPDGRGVAVVRFTNCGRCPLSWYPSQWQLTVVDAVSGKDMAGGSYPAVASVTHMRLLGWRTDSQPVVVAGDPQTLDHRYTHDKMGTWESDQSADSVRVLVLNPGAEPDPLLALPPGVRDVDIAADYLTKPVYEAGPATFGPPTNPWLLAALGYPGAVVLCSVGAVYALLKLRKRRHVEKTTT